MPVIEEEIIDPEEDEDLPSDPESREGDPTEVDTEREAVHQQLRAILFGSSNTITCGDIEYYRMLKGITQRELARIIGVSTITISRWEREPDKDKCLTGLSATYAIGAIRLNPPGKLVKQIRSSHIPNL